jgi:hypothetical protein
MSYRCVNADFRKLDIAPQSIDLIATDPPYHEKFLHLWDDLGRIAAKVLKPTGCLAAYSGKYHLPEVMDILGGHLTYRTVIAVNYNGWCRPFGRGRKNSYLTGWKPVLLYSVGEWQPPKMLKDVIQATDKERKWKKWHKWEQGLNEALYLVERLTRPGDTVLDPMAGGFTFGQAAKLLGRDFIGCDIDTDAVDIGEYRLAVGDD